MTPFHAFQDHVVAMLGRQMQMRHQAFLARQDLHQLRVRFRRVQRGQAETTKLRQRLQNRTDKIAEPRPPWKVASP